MKFVLAALMVLSPVAFAKKQVKGGKLTFEQFNEIKTEADMRAGVTPTNCEHAQALYADFVHYIVQLEKVDAQSQFVTMAEQLGGTIHTATEKLNGYMKANNCSQVQDSKKKK